MIQFKEMKKLIELLIEITLKGDNQTWLKSLKIWYSEIEIYPNDVIREIIRCSSGNGSLGDVVIYKNGLIIHNDSNLYDLYHDQLFNLCVEALPEISKNPEKEKS